MFLFDNSFLEQVGLSSMPEEQKAPFLEYTQDQLEERIGEKLSASLSDAQLNEFNGITDNDPTVINRVLSRFGSYQEDELFRRVANTVSADEALSKYILIRWLNENCPQYQRIIEECMNNLKAEISAQSNAYLAA